MWVEPKTNWMVQPYVNGRYAGDWFNISDYERITGNIAEVYGLLANIVSLPSMVAMPEQDVTGYPSASVFNAIESNLSALVSNTPSVVPEYQSKTWVSGGNSPSFSDLNRWESATLALYQWATSVEVVIPIINFILGGYQF